MSPTLDRRRAILSFAGLGAAGLTTARSVAAQEKPEVLLTSSTGAGIVVTATGKASSAADTAISQIVLRAQYAPIPIEAPQPDMTADQMPVVTANDVEVVVGILKDQGVDETMILTSVSETGYSGGYFGTGTGVVVFQIEGEQIKTLSSLIGAATGAIIEQGLLFDPVGTMLLADGCETLRADAFKDAVAVGRADAVLLADALEVTLGELTRVVKQAVTYGPAFYSYNMSDSCDSLVDLGTALRTYLPPYDATAANEFAVFATIELTFAIA